MLGAVEAAAVVVEVPAGQLDEGFVVHAAPSWFSGFLSYLAEHAGLGVAAFGAELGFETSEGLAEKSLIGDVAAAAVVVGAAVAAGGEHMKEHSGAALGGIVVEDRHSTSGNFVAIARLERHTFCAGHVPREMRLMLESWIEGYDMRLGGMVASFERQP